MTVIVDKKTGTAAVRHMADLIVRDQGRLSVDHAMTVAQLLHTCADHIDKLEGLVAVLKATRQ